MIEVSQIVEIIMLRHIIGGLVIGLAAAGISRLPAVRPHLDDSKLRLARLLDRTSLTLEGSTEHRRLLAAGIEYAADFPEGSALRQIGRSVGMMWIDIVDGKGKTRTRTCTASLVAPALLLTNQHCIRTENASDRLTLEFWLDYHGGNPTSHKVDPAPIETDAKLDFALLRLMPAATGHQPQPLGILRFRAALPGERLFMLHHAASKALQVTRTRCRAAASGSNQDLRHTCATSPGSSGALVFAEHDHAVVGLHHARRINDEFVPGAATPIAALLAKSATLRRLAPAGLLQAATR